MFNWFQRENVLMSYFHFKKTKMSEWNFSVQVVKGF